ncbi:MAG: hypothetical protein NTY22_03690 [Proteobacteria bacterium]|nr:hypothetical protein [Pseudomonadota bacterium]
MKKKLLLLLLILMPFQVMAWKHSNYLNKAPKYSLAYKFIKNRKIIFCNKSSLVNDIEIANVINSWLEAGLNNVNLSTSTISECNNPDIIIGEISLPVGIFGKVVEAGYINPYNKAEMMKNLSNGLQKAKETFADKTKYPDKWILIEKLEHFLNLVSSVEIPFIFVNNIDEAIEGTTTRRTLIHEIGHAFGMGDEDDSSPSSNFCDATNKSSIRDDLSVMSYKNENEFLSDGDKEGIAKIFERLSKN